MPPNSSKRRDGAVVRTMTDQLASRSPSADHFRHAHRMTKPVTADIEQRNRHSVLNLMFTPQSVKFTSKSLRFWFATTIFQITDFPLYRCNRLLKFYSFSCVAPAVFQRFNFIDLQVQPGALDQAVYLKQLHRTGGYKFRRLLQYFRAQVELRRGVCARYRQQS